MTNRTFPLKNARAVAKYQERLLNWGHHYEVKPIGVETGNPTRYDVTVFDSLDLKPEHFPPAAWVKGAHNEKDAALQDFVESHR